MQTSKGTPGSTVHADAGSWVTASWRDHDGAPGRGRHARGPARGGHRPRPAPGTSAVTEVDGDPSRRVRPRAHRVSARIRVDHLRRARARRRRRSGRPPRRRGGAGPRSSSASAVRRVAVRGAADRRRSRPGGPGSSGSARSQTTVPAGREQRPVVRPQDGAAGHRDHDGLGAGARASAEPAASSARKAASPSPAKSSGTVRAGRRLDLGVGVEVAPARAARPASCPTVVLPAPIMPTSRIRRVTDRTAARSAGPAPPTGCSPRAARKPSRLRTTSATESPAELAQGLGGQHQRHHRLGHHAHGRHRGDVGALLEGDRRLLGHHVDRLEHGPVEGGQRLHGHPGHEQAHRSRCRPRCRRPGRSGSRR